MSVQSGDNEALRDQADIVHHCYRDRSVTVNPIVDWTDKDVWDFLHHYGCAGNPLYQCGEKRIGCIGCPIAGSKRQKMDFLRYPKYKANYIRAFDKMLKVRKVRKESGLTNTQNWQTGLDVFKWWLGENVDQLTLFDEDELYEILSDMGG